MPVIYIFMVVLYTWYTPGHTCGVVVFGMAEADDHIFFKACGGWSEKGTVYGLGREGPTMYERPAKCRRCSAGTSLTYSPSFVAQLQDRLQTTETELQTTQSALQTTQDRLHST